MIDLTDDAVDLSDAKNTATKEGLYVQPAVQPTARARAESATKKRADRIECPVSRTGSPAAFSIRTENIKGTTVARARAGARTGLPTALSVGTESVKGATATHLGDMKIPGVPMRVMVFWSNAQFQEHFMNNEIRAGMALLIKFANERNVSKKGKAKDAKKITSLEAQIRKLTQELEWRKLYERLNKIRLGRGHLGFDEWKAMMMREGRSPQNPSGK